MKIDYIKFLILIYLITLGYCRFTEKSSKNEIIQQVWHSYEFGTGVANREEPEFSIVELKDYFTSYNGVYKWKSLKVQGEIIIIGLGKNFIVISNYDNKNNTSISEKREDLWENTIDFITFQKWDAKSQSIRNFIVISAITITNDSPNYLLKWYIIENKNLLLFSNWSFYRQIIFLEPIKINKDLKLLIISKQKNDKNNTIGEIYSLNIFPQLDIWLFEKISFNFTPSSVSVFSENENTFLLLSFSSTNTIQVWKYSKISCLQNEKHFNLHQEIFAVNPKSLNTFRVAFQWYLIIASNEPSIYKLQENNLLFHLLSNLTIKNVDNWFVIPIDNYREDKILVSTSENRLAAFALNENGNIRNIQNVTQNLCKNDSYCEKGVSKINIMNSTSFPFKGYQFIIMPTESGISLMMKLIFKLKSLPDVKVLKLNELLETKKVLEKNYSNLSARIIRMTTNRHEFRTHIEKSTNSYLQISQEKTENNENLKTFSSTQNWMDIYMTLEKLNEKINLLINDIQKFQSQQDKSLNSFKRSELFMQQKGLPKGITFYGNVVINNLNVTVLNDYKTDDLFKNSYRKNNKGKIGGIKTLKNIKANHVTFDKVKNVSSCDIIFADDFLEKKSLDINGDVIFENSLNIFNDVEIMYPENIQEDFDKLTTVIPDIQKDTFDILHFEELEILDETDILTSVNSQLLILPVHNIPVDIHYLNVANQARIETVNVKSNLIVDYINAQNFNNLTNQILFKDKIRKERYKTAKIDGVLLVDSLVVNKIMPKLQNLGETILNTEVKLSQTDSNSNYDISKKFFQNYRDSGIKRKIHVYQNLEINGTLHTNKINQLDWSLLNDTIRKGFKAIFNGKKLFKKTVMTNGVNIYGTINDVNPESFLNNVTKQTIQFPQTFNKVQFINLTLKGTWDEINLKNFNLSLINPFKFKGNLSLSNCPLVTENLEVIDFINDVNLKNLSESKRNIDAFFESAGSLKVINASRVIIRGSLLANKGINNINLSSFNEKRISIKKPQIVQQNISLNNTKFQGIINIINLNGKNVSNIINPGGDIRIIEKFLKGEMTKIKKLLVKGEINTADGINGCDLSDLSDNGIQIIESNFIDDSLIFENMVFFDKLNVSGTVNNIDLRQLEKDLIFSRDIITLSNAKNFTKLKITKDSNIRSLNGHNIENIVTLQGYHIIKGTLQINGHVIVRGNVTSNGAINDFILPPFLRKYSTQHNSYIVTEDLYLSKNYINISNLLVGGKIQNIDFDALMEKAVLKDESFNVGDKLFKGEVRFNKNIFVEETINSLDVKKLFSDIVTVDEPAKVEGSVTIEKAVLNTVYVKNYFNSSLINNIDMNDWFEESILLDEGNVNVNGKMTFEKPQATENVEVDFINDQISSAVILLDEKQHIPITISFENVNINSNLNVGGFVNGKNLLKEYEDSILTNKSEVFKGSVIFLKDFTINGSLSINSIKGKAINDLITLDTSQTITNILDFQGSVAANKGIKNLYKINSIDLIDWDNRSVLLNREQEINGFWEVKGSVKAKDIKGEAFVDSVSLFNISKVIQQYKKKAIERKNETEIEYYSQCRRIEQFSEKYTKQLYIFNQFEIYQIIETALVIESVIPFKISDSDYQIVTFSNNCLSTLYKWDKNSSMFIRVRHINIGPVSNWLVLYQNSTTFLITSTINSNVDCEEDLLPGNIWKFEDNSDKYVHLYTTDSFIDAIKDNDTSQTFYTLEENGNVFQWFLKSGINISFKLLVSLGQGNYKFIDKRIFNNLAVSNGKEIKIIKSSDEKIIVDTFFLHNNYIVALPIGEKTFAAVVIKDKIVVYENLREEKISSILHTFKAHSLLWFNYGLEKQAFLIVSSYRKVIEVYEYKSASGLVKRTSLPLFSTKLQSVSLPLKNKFQLSKFVIVIHKKKIVFLEAEMLGDFFEISDSFC